MRHSVATLAAICAVAAALPAGAVAGARPAGVAATARARVPAHLLVQAQEWSLWPSRPSVPAGTIAVQLWNRGQDAHDLRVRRLDSRGRMVGRVLGAVRTTLSGQIGHATWRLGAGRYELYCSMPGHLKLGMHARLTVTRDRAGATRG
ncbi:MAG: hypothetical protein ACRDMX_18195 [Solirubrobacteraceae bacterium]